MTDASWVDAPASGDGARAVQRPRRPASGDDRPARRRHRRDVGRAAAPRRAGPERRVLRPDRPDRCSAAGSPPPADHRASPAPSPAGQPIGSRRRRAGLERAAGPGRADEERRAGGWPGPVAAGGSGRGAPSRRPWSATSTALPGRGPVRSAASVSAGASAIRRHLGAADHERLGEHDRVVEHEAGRHEHEPAPGEAVPAAAAASPWSRWRARSRSRRGSTPWPRAGAARQDGAGPDDPDGDRGHA